MGITTVFSDTADVSRILQERALRLVKVKKKEEEIQHCVLKNHNALIFTFYCNCQSVQEVTLEVEEAELDRGGRPDIHLDFSVPPRIIFNRPFMIIIYDYFTGIVLLMGRIVDPTDV